MPKRLTKEEFIFKSKEVHGNDKYSYDEVLYQNNSTKVTIKCCKHKENFEQLPLNHLKGQGCPKCGRVKNTKNTTKTTEQFIKEAKEIHGDTYDYSKVIYKGVHNKVILLCKEHGEFKQTPRNHLALHGCLSCAKESREGSWNETSWEKQAENSLNFTGYKLYLIECGNKYEKFYKVGITFKEVKTRLSVLPYNYKILKIVKSDNSKKIFELERTIKNITRKFKYTPKIKFNGSVQECFSKLSEEVNNKIRNYEQNNKNNNRSAAGSSSTVMG